MESEKSQEDFFAIKAKFCLKCLYDFFVFNFNFNYNALVLAFACFVKVTRLFQKNGHDENTECKTCPNQGKAQ